MKLAGPLVVLGLAALASRDAASAGPDPVPVTLAGYVHLFDAGYAIGGETDPYGWVLSPEVQNRPISLTRIAYLESADGSVDLAKFAGLRCSVRGLLFEDALSAGGVETAYRTFDLLRVESVVPKEVHAPPQGGRLVRLLLADLARRGIDFDRDGAAEPSGGLSPDGRIDGRRRAKVVGLEIPPEDSADMHTVLAFVDVRSRRYWAHRSGGFIGVSQWVGPFRLPRNVLRWRQSLRHR